MTNEFPAELAGLVGRPPGRAAFLVGESPLPVYAAIALLRPESIMLLYSDPSVVPWAASVSRTP